MKSAFSLQPSASSLQPSASSLFLIAGNGTYPFLIARGARAAGVKKIVVAAFEGETDPLLADEADEMIWMRVGQVGKLLSAARKSEASHGIMAGQIAPKNLFDLRPDLKALVLLATLKERNAESLFSTLACELEKAGVALLPATTFLEESLVTSGWIAGPKLRKRALENIEFGHRIAKEVSRLDIGQTVIVKNGTVLAVEGFEGTDETIKRGGMLGRCDACMVKVSKPNQDMRFDVPVIGTKTLETAAAAGISIIALETGCTLLLEKEKLLALAEQLGVTLWGVG
ncbi:MAG: UDP-2,3-diacylglucosamine diphosphatase LpxI [Chthoniobacterales bacterium]|nr:UDP-2,3-diacylglucosamine diphosphatase LpxI [Chthoniobacterales bacterium]